MAIWLFLSGALLGWGLEVCLRRAFLPPQADFCLRRALATALAAGACFAWAQARFGLGLSWMRAAAFGFFLIAVARVDFERLLIFDRLLLPLAALGALLCLLAPRWIAAAPVWDEALLGAALGGGALAALAWLAPGGMGGGDVKFAAALGLWLGWQGILLTLYLAFVVGGSVAALLLWTGRKRRGDPVPFGPFLALAAWAVCLYGAELADCFRAALA